MAPRERLGGPQRSDSRDGRGVGDHYLTNTAAPDASAMSLDYVLITPARNEGDFHSYRDSHINVHHVNGQVQLFRRTCFEEIGGYVPIKGGGIDWVAVTTARMKGWTTYSFGERVFEHHRKMGTAGGSELGAR